MLDLCLYLYIEKYYLKILFNKMKVLVVLLCDSFVFIYVCSNLASTLEEWSQRSKKWSIQGLTFFLEHHTNFACFQHITFPLLRMRISVQNYHKDENSSTYKGKSLIMGVVVALFKFIFNLIYFKQ